MFRLCALWCSIALCSVLAAQSNLKERNQPPAPSQNAVRVEAGTHVLLSMINSVSTKQAVVGDRMYLETAFPVMVNGRIVIPRGSWVTGTITDVKRPGRVKGRGSLQVHFDSLTLPNGITRNFRADLGAIDATSNEKLQKEKSTIEGSGGKGKDTATVVGASTAGTVIGSGVGAAAGHAGMGAGIGAAAGGAAGLIGVLTSRGPDAVLARGSTVEMVLDRGIEFEESDLNAKGTPPRADASSRVPF